MYWVQENVGKVVAAAVIVVLTMVSLGWWLSSSNSSVEANLNGIEQVATGTASGAPESSLPAPGVPSRDPRTGELPSEFVIEFVEKLNEVNTYVAKNRPSTSETKGIYRELWRWAELGGLTLQGFNVDGSVISSNAGNANASPLVDIRSLEGDTFCAVAVELVNPELPADGTQVLVAKACKDVLANE